MGDLGLFGLVVPEEFGGAESATSPRLCVAIEELGRVDQSIGITLSAGVGLGINPILTYGTQEQKERWLPDLVAGRALAGFGLTEPEAGSDAGATRTKARLDGDEWVVNGAKAFITNSGTDITSVVTVTARTGQNEDGSPQISAIMVPSGTPGFTVEPAYDKLGWHASDTHGLSFERLPRAGRPPARRSAGERLQAVPQDPRRRPDRHPRARRRAAPRRASRPRTDYAKTRIAFGRPIGVNQGVSFQIADLAVMVEAARAAHLQGRLAQGRARRRPPLGRGGQAGRRRSRKLYSTEAAVTATRIATQVFGGNGFMEEYPVARFYRDAKILEIGEGTSEVQRMVIARGLGLPSA